MTTEEKRVTLHCLTSEIDAFAKELTARGGPRRDHYGNPVHDVVLAHLRLLESARVSIERIRPE